MSVTNKVAHDKHETKRLQNLKEISTKFTDMVVKQHAQTKNKDRSLALFKKHTSNLLDWNEIEDENPMFDESYTFNDKTLAEIYRDNLQNKLSWEKFLRLVHTVDLITLREAKKLDARTDTRKKTDRIREARLLRETIAKRTNKVGGRSQTKKRKHK